MNPLLKSLEKIKQSHPMAYYMGHLLTSWPINFISTLRHPMMIPELKRCAINQLEMFVPFSKRLGLEEYFMKLPKNGLRYEGHSHTSNFSPDAKCELSDVVNNLFEKDIDIWALTDHNNSFAFGQLVSGEYKLKEDKFGEKYEINPDSDGRSLIIKRKEDQKELVMLRSIEYWTDMGEIGIYGYNTKLPNEGLHLYGIRGKNIPLKEAIDIGIDGGGYIVINHPYDNDGIGWVDEGSALDETVNSLSKNDKIKKFKLKKGILKKPFRAIKSWKQKNRKRNTYTREFLKEAIGAVEEIGSQRRFIAIEKNVAQVAPKLFCPVKAAGLAKKLDLPFVATGDAHTLKMYARSGVVFDEDTYDLMFDLVGENHADAVKALISNKKFKNYSNYPTYGQIIDWQFL